MGLLTKHCSYFVFSDISCMVFAKRETTVDILMIWPAANLQPWFASSFRRETVCLETVAGKDTTKIKSSLTQNPKMIQMWMELKRLGCLYSTGMLRVSCAPSCQWSSIITSFLKPVILSAKWQHSSFGGGFSEVLQHAAQVDLTPETAAS